MHTVPQNKDKFTINNLFYCCKFLTFTQPFVYEFLCVQFQSCHPLMIGAVLNVPNKNSGWKVFQKI